MHNNKITSRPPEKKSVQDFILDAENKNKNEIKQKNIKIEYPWEKIEVRSDVQKVFTAKLPEEVIIKIKYISEKTNNSQQKIVREIIKSGIDNIIAELIAD